MRRKFYNGKSQNNTNNGKWVLSANPPQLHNHLHSPPLYCLSELLLHFQISHLAFSLPILELQPIIFFQQNMMSFSLLKAFLVFSGFARLEPNYLGWYSEPLSVWLCGLFSSHISCYAPLPENMLQFKYARISPTFKTYTTHSFIYAFTYPDPS